ncbi:hypothetical protein ABH931_005236 [Streptacidiphilus sp. MAP12-33]|uniref:hypothetical protein n=1 Tax=Streptacidiphilus sp. MAP12-33 TaxID=3156266 RepID=UPI003514A4A4
MSPRLTVPFITSRHGEVAGPLSDIVLGPGGLRYRDEVPADRDGRGALWGRCEQALSDAPRWRDVNPVRQRLCMERMLCQVCTGPADRNESGWLFLHGPDGTGSGQTAEGVLTAQPPLCLPHALRAAVECPHLDGRPVAMRVRRPLLYGVLGTVYLHGHQGEPLALPGGDPVPFGDPRLPWTLASQLVCCLLGVTVTDLSREASLRRAAQPTGRKAPMHSEDSKPTLPREELNTVLMAAAEIARVRGSSRLPEGRELPELVLLAADNLPEGVSFDPAALADWLAREQVDADVNVDEADRGTSGAAALSPRTPQAVRALAAALLGTHAAAREAAQSLGAALAAAGIEVTVREQGAEHVVFSMNDFDWEDKTAGAVSLAACLGGQEAVDDLPLYRRSGRRKLARRLRLLLTGAVGPVAMAMDEGCGIHEPDHVSLKLSLDQAERLGARLSWAHPEDDPTTFESGLVT